MNTQIIKQLILKDWYFQRWMLSAYISGCFITLFGVIWGQDIVRTISASLFVMAVMSLSMYLIFTTVINERKQGNLSFVMSLPITVKDYTIAKMVANAAAFVIPWSVLFTIAIYAIATLDFLAAGWVPIISITLVYILVFYSVMLTVSLAFESEGWTIFAMVAFFMTFTFAFMWVKGLDGIAPYIQGDKIVWSSDALTVLAAELLSIVGMLGLTFFFQSRKTDFL
ncbi:MAG: hypothetical protein COB37_08285 [Kordiimonadales bacterium]|nr:MAG: hypothetical protein COB37_08285 [Kordiimonadales bacterium]